MKVLIMIFAFLLNVSGFAQFSDSTSVVRLDFSETMNVETLQDENNYSIKDEFGSFKKVYAVYKTTNDSQSVAIICERLENNVEYLIEVRNVKDRAGNVIGDKNGVSLVARFFRPELKKPKGFSIEKN